MKEYNEHIRVYSQEGYGWFSNTVLAEDWGNIDLADKYLINYWLSKEEYEHKWKKIQEEIFVSLEVTLPKQVFRNQYNTILLTGGCLFTREDFEQLQCSLLGLEETHILVIENDLRSEPAEPLFRMKYPSDISWEELTNGNFISSTILEHPHKEFFVFGSKPWWGKYSASDYILPLDVLGFKTDHSNIFKELIDSSIQSEEQVQQWLPR